MNDKLNPTPGPWKWENQGSYWNLMASNGFCICDDGSAGGEYSQQIDPTGADAALIAAAPELLEAVKLAYRKHHLSDDTIGWEELSEKLLDALCNAMGSSGFLEWVKSATNGDRLP